MLKILFEVQYQTKNPVYKYSPRNSFEIKKKKPTFYMKKPILQFPGFYSIEKF